MISTIDGTGRVQTYPKEQFEKLWPVPDGAVQNGFERLGYKVTPLNNPGVADEFDENDDIDLPAIPSADTATTQADEIKKDTLEAVEEGDAETPAEKFARRSQEDAETKTTEVKISDEEKEKAKEAKADSEKSATKPAAKK